MADNTTFQSTVATPPSGLIVATDDVAGVHFQKIKLDVGGDGATAMLGNSNPLPVSDAGGSLTVDVSGSVTIGTLPSGTWAGQAPITADYDSGGGTQNMPLVGVALPASGGGVAGGSFTNPFRVDPTGTTTQPVSDGGGSLTVDGSVSLAAAIPAGNNNIGDVDVASIAAGDNVIGRTKLTDGTTVATVSNYTNSKPLNVRLTDTNGDYIAAGAGTQYTEDAASAADPVGNMLIVRRRDTLTVSEVSADSDNIAVNATSKGEVYVKHTDAIPVTDNGGLLSIDDGAGSITVDGTVGLSAGTNNIGDVDVLTVPAPLNLTGGGVEASALRVTIASDSTGLVSVDDNGSTLSIDDGAGSITVDGTVSVNLNAGTNNIGDVDVLTVPAPLNVTGNGTAAAALRVTLANDSTGLVAAAGTVAHDSPATGNPFQVAGEARNADITAVANGDVARFITTLLGKIVTYPWALPGSTWNYAAASGGITTTTGVTAKAAAGAGIRNYITSIQVINGHASVDTDVQIRDGASGTVLWREFAKSGGGGISLKCDPPLRGTANTLVEVACGTTGSAVYVNLQGYTSAE